MDAITLLKKDHKDVEALFRRYEQAGDRAFVEKRRLVDRMIEELSRHAAVEEQLFYPAARVTVPGTEDIALESIEEHHIVKWELSELQDMDPHDETFDAKVAVLIENVRHHVEEEESDFFPKVRDELGRNDLNDLGEAMESARMAAPTRPHPRLPQTPPFNTIGGLVAGAADMVGDTAKGVVQGVVAAAKDVVERVTGASVGRAAPMGSSRTQAQARRVREGAGKAVDRVDDAVSEVEDGIESTRRAASAAGSGAKRTATVAARGATSTAKAAAAGAKGTATSARKGAAAARTTSKRAATTTGHTAEKAARSTRRTAKGAASSTKAAARS